jgi:hypothetical protein
MLLARDAAAWMSPAHLSATAQPEIGPEPSFPIQSPRPTGSVPPPIEGTCTQHLMQGPTLAASVSTWHTQPSVPIASL